MMGCPEASIPGLYIQAANDIFLIAGEPQNQVLMVGVSFYDIYCGKAYDLLKNRQKCAIRVDKKDNVNIVGLSEKIIQNTQSLISLIHAGL